MQTEPNPPSRFTGGDRRDQVALHASDRDALDRGKRDARPRDDGPPRHGGALRLLDSGCAQTDIRGRDDCARHRDPQPHASRRMDPLARVSGGRLPGGERGAEHRADERAGQPLPHARNRPARPWVRAVGRALADPCQRHGPARPAMATCHLDPWYRRGATGSFSAARDGGFRPRSDLDLCDDLGFPAQGLNEGPATPRHRYTSVYTLPCGRMIR